MSMLRKTWVDHYSTYYRVDGGTLELEVFALRGIKAGEELTISCETESYPSLLLLR